MASASFMLSGTTTPVETPATVNIVRGTHPQLVAFLVLNIWPSHFGIPILLAVTLLSKKIHRHATFVNLCITFIIVGFSASLLLVVSCWTTAHAKWKRELSFQSVYAGRAIGPEPSPMLCLTQASLLYGFPPLTSIAAFMLVLQMFLVVRASYYGKEMRDHVTQLWAMLIIPYVFFFVVVLVTAIIGASNPFSISRSRRFFYCSVEYLPLTNTVTIFAAIFLFATVLLEVWTMVLLYKRYLVSKKIGAKLGSLNLSMQLRILAFGFYLTIALSLSLLSVTAPESPVPDLIIASAATFLLLIFGTQKDVIEALRFWNKEKIQAYK